VSEIAAQHLQEQIEEQWRNEFMELETTLTMHQLFLLLGIETGTEGCGVHEPIWTQITKTPLPPITLAPGLSESSLLEMAQARALERLTLIELEMVDGGACWKLTAKGKAAVAWWREVLADCALDEETPSSLT